MKGIKIINLVQENEAQEEKNVKYIESKCKMTYVNLIIFITLNMN